jgi:hypothetical protein
MFQKLCPSCGGIQNYSRSAKFLRHDEEEQNLYEVIVGREM